MKPLLCATILLLLTGCNTEPRGTLTGHVTKNGEPVTQAMVLFENAAEGRSINISVDETGSFKAMSEGKAGLPPGTYQVAVRPDAFASSDQPPPLVEAGASSTTEASTTIPKKYQDPATSEISVTVVEGENPPLEIELAK
jgi:hypothetical protein